VFGWQTLFVTVTGLVAGVAAGLATMLTATRAITGSWTPFIQFAPAALITGGVAVLTAAAIMIPFRFMSRREPVLG
jgi:hypothetical protein